MDQTRPFRGIFLRWLAAACIVYGTTGAVCLWVLQEPWSKLGYYFLYMSVSNGLFPLAVNPPTVALGALYSPFLVALVGAVATLWANLSEYILLGPVFAHKKAETLKKTSTYQGLVQLFSRAPRLCITIASFLPLPVDLVRWTAISTGFPMRQFLASDFVGRYLRYLLLASLGDIFRDNAPLLWGLVILLLVLPLLAAAWRKLRHQPAVEAAPVESSPE